jgi:hypothetical protein
MQRIITFKESLSDSYSRISINVEQVIGFEVCIINGNEIIVFFYTSRECPFNFSKKYEGNEIEDEAKKLHNIIFKFLQSEEMFLNLSEL